jgi:small-conductance mechanosensitive channel
VRIASFFTLLAAMLAVPQFSAVTAQAQVPEATLEDPEPVIQRAPEDQSDTEIEERLSSIYSEFGALLGVQVRVEDGVVTLSGEVANETDADRALGLAIRVEGVVTVRDQIDRTLTIEDNLAPVFADIHQQMGQWIKALPLLAIAFAIFLVIAGMGHLLASWKWLWKTLAPNAFLAEILSQAVRITILILGLFIALNLVGATALMAAILGGAGVAGLAIGFAIRDTLENYISSVMLSMRQPFRSGDHVIIGEKEGIVSRLTTRSTILMTLDGNHLRIPNAEVFKAQILNFTTNPTRRLSFKLGVDAADDPIAAINIGKSAISDLDFVLEDPAPHALIESVGDSSIILVFYAWIDQRQADFAKSRSLAIRATKDVIEANGFTLPEPIYRLRFDNSLQSVEASAPDHRRPGDPKSSSKTFVSDEANEFDIKPEVEAVRDVAEKTSTGGAEENLLDNTKPKE